MVFLPSKGDGLLQPHTVDKVSALARLTFFEKFSVDWARNRVDVRIKQVACVQTSPLPPDFFLREGGRLYTGYKRVE